MAEKCDQIISEGERWSVFDILDAATIASFDSWGVMFPEERAREVFESYPRRASLLREKVVKYEREIVDIDPIEDDGSPSEPDEAEEAERRRAYQAGEWCGECRWGVVEDPPCCTLPEPDVKEADR
ncbi:hypothetical protein [Agromyces aureus]|uniref:Uncharacterized protein n=1 Tax=Agromyces aureus TaxID=453304 RepID=A0A191WF49_9MICO|nr:hypothetical protein [Agromyces aureus]ANJ26804.1 hypothetical protein ATC03_08830 [Agromyces aureus]